MRYDQLIPIIDDIKPKTIIEVGTHLGVRAVLMCGRALIFHRNVHYIGYDLFELATAETNRQEMNGKSSAVMRAAQERLGILQKEYPEFTYELIKGNTRETLHGKSIKADFVFIDGGHSVETIRGDYNAVKESKVIVFDDYYLSGVDVGQFGCNEIVKGIPHTLLPKVDVFDNLRIKMAMTL